MSSRVLLKFLTTIKVSNGCCFKDLHFTWLRNIIEKKSTQELDILWILDFDFKVNMSFFPKKIWCINAYYDPYMGYRDFEINGFHYHIRFYYNLKV